MAIGMETAITATDKERRTMDKDTNRDMNGALNKEEIGIDLSEVRPLSKDQEDAILILELNRLKKKGAISAETFLRTMEEWGV
jgi:hypothetical protein